MEASAVDRAPDSARHVGCVKRHPSLHPPRKLSILNARKAIRLLNHDPTPYTLRPNSRMHPRMTYKPIHLTSAAGILGALAAAFTLLPAAAGLQNPPPNGEFKAYTEE